MNISSSISKIRRFYCLQAAWMSVGSTATLALLLVLPLLLSSCKSLVKVSDTTIPRLLTPTIEADFNQLTAQLKPFTEFKTLRASQVEMRFIEAEIQERIRFDAGASLVLQRPDKIRLVVQAPAIRTKVAEMVSVDNHFKVAVYYPDDKRHFLLGTNDADYSHLRGKLGKEGQSPLVNARPFHFTEALLMRPLRLGEAGYAYSLEEALQEEADSRKGAKSGARVWHSFYVIAELELLGEQARVRRKFWFDRTNQLRLTRQQMFDERSGLATEIHYSAYQKLSAESQDLWPSVVLVARPRDGYAARLTFNSEKFELNPELPELAFVLENNDKLPETDLDKKEK
jgi:hypothetical protein